MEPWKWSQQVVLVGGPRGGEIIAVEYRTPTIEFAILLPHALHPWCAGEDECLAPYIEKIEYRRVADCVYKYVEPENEAVRYAVASMRRH